MSSPEEKLDDLLGLLNSLVDGTITQEQSDSLSQLIKSEPEIRSVCVNFLQLSAGLHYHAEQSLSAYDPADDKLADIPGKPACSLSNETQRTARAEGLRKTGLTWHWLAIAVSVAILSTASYLAIPWTRLSGPGPIAASWTNGVGVHWSASDLNYVGSTLGSKQYKLLQGVAEVTFDSGAVLVMEGPAQFSIDSSDSITITQGQLVARVPESASSFSICNSATELFDSSGEVGIRVFQGGSAEVHVFEGEASVRPKLPQSRHVISTQLSAGDSRRIDSSGAMQEVGSDEIQATSFVRNVGAVVQIDTDLPKPQIADDFNDGKPGWLTGFPYADADPYALRESDGKLVGIVKAGTPDPFFHVSLLSDVIEGTQYPYLRFRLEVDGSEAYRSNQVFYRTISGEELEAHSLQFFSGRKQSEEFHARIPTERVPIEVLRLDPIGDTPESQLEFAYDYIYFDPFETIGLAEFDSEGDAQDWHGINLISSRVNGGCFQGSFYGVDAALRTADIQVDADRFDHLELRLKLESHIGPIALSWGKWGDSFSPDKKAVIKPVVDGQFHRYLIDLRRASGWNGMIRLMRLEFGEAVGTQIELDYLRAIRLQGEQVLPEAPAVQTFHETI